MAGEATVTPATAEGRVIYVKHRPDGIFRVVALPPPKKGYRLEFFDGEGAFAYETGGAVLRAVLKAVDAHRDELAKAAAAPAAAADEAGESET